MRVHDQNRCGCPCPGWERLQRLVAAVCEQEAWKWPTPRVEAYRPPGAYGCTVRRGLIRLSPDAPVCTVAHELAHTVTFGADWPDQHGARWERLYRELLVTVHDVHTQLA